MRCFATVPMRAGGGSSMQSLVYRVKNAKNKTLQSKEGYDNLYQEIHDELKQLEEET